jgi:Spy/CpxP family protein refolding chaperone
MKPLTVLIPLAVAGALMAQTSAPPASSPTPGTPAPNTRHFAKARRDGAVNRLTRLLSLTADQQSRVKSIFASARLQAKPLRAMMHEERVSLHQAVKNDSEQQIDQITHQNADLLAQMQAVHVKVMAKVYAILTLEQKAKYEKAWGPRNVG